MGFGAKLCVHPGLIVPIHQAFTPSKEQTEQARQVIKATAQSLDGAYVLNGRMMDAPGISLARRTQEKIRN